jgi:hypothetical protein
LLNSSICGRSSSRTKGACSFSRTQGFSNVAPYILFYSLDKSGHWSPIMYLDLESMTSLMETAHALIAFLLAICFCIAGHVMALRTGLRTVSPAIRARRKRTLLAVHEVISPMLTLPTLCHVYHLYNLSLFALYFSFIYSCPDFFPSLRFVFTAVVPTMRCTTTLSSGSTAITMSTSENHPNVDGMMMLRSKCKSIPHTKIPGIQSTHFAHPYASASFASDNSSFIASTYLTLELFNIQ